jgi:hypothetical protein
MQVGTIGTNRGMYTAHLHFEIRQNLAIGINRSAFRNDLVNYHKPTPFIRAHRNLPGSGRSALVAVNTFTVPNNTFGPPVDESLRRGGSGTQVADRRTEKRQPSANQQNNNQRTFRVNRFEDLGAY